MNCTRVVFYDGAGNVYREATGEAAQRIASRSAPIMTMEGPRKVRVSRTGIALFNRQYPCSTLSVTRAYWFEFAEDGELINDDIPSHDECDETATLAADCLAWLDDGTSPDWAPDGVE